MSYCNTHQDLQSYNIAHYHKLAMYDQLYAHASRINQSLGLPNHEYIPYQLVIVFVRQPFAYIQVSMITHLLVLLAMSQPRRYILY